MGKKSDLYNSFIGKFVICRTRNEGVNAGRVVSICEGAVLLSSARRLYYHKPSDQSLAWYEGVAVSGVSPESRLSGPVEKLISEDYSLTICTAAAEASILAAKINA